MFAIGINKKHRFYGGVWFPEFIKSTHSSVDLGGLEPEPLHVGEVGVDRVVDLVLGDRHADVLDQGDSVFPLVVALEGQLGDPLPVLLLDVGEARELGGVSKKKTWVNLQVFYGIKLASIIEKIKHV